MPILLLPYINWYLHQFEQIKKPNDYLFLGDKRSSINFYDRDLNRFLV